MIHITFGEWRNAGFWGKMKTMQTSFALVLVTIHTHSSVGIPKHAASANAFSALNLLFLSKRSDVFE
jgi:hypothetical protein